MQHPHDKQRQRGFTLIEVALSMVILSIILLVAVQVLNQTQRAWKRGVTRVEQFREARMAFDSITENLRQAILNTYLAYQYNKGSTPTIPTSKTQVPTKYIRQSELQFVTGLAPTLLPGGQASTLVTHAMFFQARLGLSDRVGYEGLNRLLCGRGVLRHVQRQHRFPAQACDRVQQALPAVGVPPHGGGEHGLCRQTGAVVPQCPGECDHGK